MKHLVIVGATGMVGGYALRYALEDHAVERVTAIGRRKLGISSCLGAYTGAVPDAELRTITVDYTIEFARVLRGRSPNAAFSFLSGNGCGPDGTKSDALRTL